MPGVHFLPFVLPHLQRLWTIFFLSSRTSTGTYLKRDCDKIVQDVEKRIADITSLPVEHGEDLYILHYEVGQKFEPHHDYYEDDAIPKNGGQRIATVLMYLSDVEEGGETVFPSAKVNRSSLPGYSKLFKCVKKGLVTKPKMGDALLFWSIKPDGSVDTSTLHGSCPVVKGNKWASIKLIDAKEI